jgi:hypothetical protein
MKQNLPFALSLLTLTVSLAPEAAELSAPKFNALLQSWVVSDSTTTPANPNFRIRRSELKASGTAGEELQWFVMIDPAKAITGTAGDDNKILQDLGITWTFSEGFEATLGQFKTRTTAEGLAPTAEIPLPEKSIIGRYYGDKREPGFLLSYKHDALKAAAMVSNGAKTNNDDSDNKKDLSARVDYQINEAWSAGLFTLAKNFSYSDLGRWGLNVNYAQGPLTVRVEGVYQNATGSQKSYGWMGDVAYQLDRWEPVARFEQFRKNQSVDITASIVSAGLNYLLEGKKSKLQLAYTFLSNIDAPNGTSSADTVALDKSGSLLCLSFQAAF